MLGARDVERGEEARRAIVAAAGGGPGGDDPSIEFNVQVLPLDTSEMSSVRAFAFAVSKLHGAVDVVVGAAAEIGAQRRHTRVGIVDKGFATNHLGLQSLLTQLEPALRAGAAGPSALLAEGEASQPRSRVVIVGSRLEAKGQVDCDALECTRGEHIRDPRPESMQESSNPQSYRVLKGGKFEPMLHYADSKHANQLLATQLAARWRAAGERISVFSVTPGMVDTGLWRDFPLWYRALTYPVRAIGLRSAEEAAAGVVYACTAAALEPAALSGAYLSDGKEIEPSEPSQDAAKAARLYELCAWLIAREERGEQY